MIRYINQRDRSSCGPIAILNLLKWAGKKVTEKEHKSPIKKMCKCLNKNSSLYAGTRPGRLNAVVCRIQAIEVKKVKRFAKMREVNKHLSSGGACLLRILWNDRGDLCGHYTLCIGRNKRGYKMVNLYSNRGTICYADKANMKEMLYNSILSFEGRDDPIVWFVRRR